MLIRARVVLPINSPPIENGAVLVSQNRIAGVGAWRDLTAQSSGPSVDLGAMVLMPGLVNAHCHLDYTNMTGMPPQKQFPDWIKGLLALKAAASYSDYAEAWLRGAKMLERTGCTTVADIEAVPELLPEVWSSTSLRVFSFLEMTGVRSLPQTGGDFARSRRENKKPRIAEMFRRIFAPCPLLDKSPVASPNGRPREEAPFAGGDAPGRIKRRAGNVHQAKRAYV